MPRTTNKHSLLNLKAIHRLEEVGVEYRLIELSNRAYTVSDVVRFSEGKLKIDEICKTIIMKDNDGFYAVLLLGDDRIDFKKLKKMRESKPRIADGGEVSEVAGVEPGAVCPLILDIPLIVDPAVFSREKVNFGSGHHLYGLEMAPQDINKVVEYKSENIAR